MTTPQKKLEGIFLSYDHCENECHLEGMILEKMKKAGKIQ